MRDFNPLSASGSNIIIAVPAQAGKVLIKLAFGKKRSLFEFDIKPGGEKQFKLEGGRAKTRIKENRGGGKGLSRARLPPQDNVHIFVMAGDRELFRRSSPLEAGDMHLLILKHQKFMDVSAENVKSDEEREHTKAKELAMKPEIELGHECSSHDIEIYPDTPRVDVESSPTTVKPPKNLPSISIEWAPEERNPVELTNKEKENEADIAQVVESKTRNNIPLREQEEVALIRPSLLDLLHDKEPECNTCLEKPDIITNDSSILGMRLHLSWQSKPELEEKTQLGIEPIAEVKDVSRLQKVLVQENDPVVPEKLVDIPAPPKEKDDDKAAPIHLPHLSLSRDDYLESEKVPEELPLKRTGDKSHHLERRMERVRPQHDPKFTTKIQNLEIGSKNLISSSKNLNEIITSQKELTQENELKEKEKAFTSIEDELTLIHSSSLPILQARNLEPDKTPEKLQHKINDDRNSDLENVMERVRPRFKPAFTTKTHNLEAEPKGSIPLSEKVKEAKESLLSQDEPKAKNKATESPVSLEDNVEDEAASIHQSRLTTLRVDRPNPVILEKPIKDSSSSKLNAVTHKSPEINKNQESSNQVHQILPERLDEVSEPVLEEKMSEQKAPDFPTPSMKDDGNKETPIVLTGPASLQNNSRDSGMVPDKSNEKVNNNEILQKKDISKTYSFPEVEKKPEGSSSIAKNPSTAINPGVGNNKIKTINPKSSSPTPFIRPSRSIMLEDDERNPSQEKPQGYKSSYISYQRQGHKSSSQNPLRKEATRDPIQAKFSEKETQITDTPIPPALTKNQDISTVHPARLESLNKTIPDTNSFLDECTEKRVKGASVSLEKKRFRRASESESSLKDTTFSRQGKSPLRKKTKDTHAPTIKDKEDKEYYVPHKENLIRSNERPRKNSTEKLADRQKALYGAVIPRSDRKRPREEENSKIEIEGSTMIAKKVSEPVSEWEAGENHSPLPLEGIHPARLAILQQKGLKDKRSLGKYSLVVPRRNEALPHCPSKLWDQEPEKNSEVTDAPQIAPQREISPHQLKLTDDDKPAIHPSRLALLGPNKQESRHRPSSRAIRRVREREHKHTSMDEAKARDAKKAAAIVAAKFNKEYGEVGPKRRFGRSVEQCPASSPIKPIVSRMEAKVHDEYGPVAEKRNVGLPLLEKEEKEDKEEKEEAETELKRYRERVVQSREKARRGKNKAEFVVEEMEEASDIEVYTLERPPVSPSRIDMTVYVSPITSPSIDDREE